jgi:hypothetical protein
MSHSLPLANVHSPADLGAQVARSGFAFVEGETMQRLLAVDFTAAAWQNFAASWDELPEDTYMADYGRYRRRRYAVYRYDGGTPTREPHQPHFQALTYNSLNGDVERWFAPILGTPKVLMDCLKLFTDTFAEPTRAWHLEVHQFRIEATPGSAGKPTPEGAHRDGVDRVLVLLIQRRNIARGVTRISTPTQQPLGEFTLTLPLDAAWLDDTRVYHGVTPVFAQDPTQYAARDVLVITGRRLQPDGVRQPRSL